MLFVHVYRLVRGIRTIFIMVNVYVHGYHGTLVLLCYQWYVTTGTFHVRMHLRSVVSWLMMRVDRRVVIALSLSWGFALSLSSTLRCLCVGFVLTASPSS